MTALDDATLAAIAARDAWWSPKPPRDPLVCWFLSQWGRCGLRDWATCHSHDASCRHPAEHPPFASCHLFHYDPALDASAEADRRRLLAEVTRLRRELGERDCEDGDGR